MDWSSTCLVSYLPTRHRELEQAESVSGVPHVDLVSYEAAIRCHEGSSTVALRTSIWPVTASAMRRVRYSFIRSI